MPICDKTRGFNLYNIQQINNKVKLFFIFFSIDAGIIQFGRHLTKKDTKKAPNMGLKYKK
jgi:hypothetical protein